MAVSPVTKTSYKKPTVNYFVYALALFTIIIIAILSIKGTKLDNYCPAKQVPCQVYLTKGEKSPYRTNVHAAYTGWHFSGYIEMKACWVGYPDFCDICNDTVDARNIACDSLYPRHQVRASR